MSIRIESLSTTAGFLKEAPISFAPQLTCIIGARGTCKSTVVETLRFVFDCDRDRVQQLLAPPDARGTSETPSSRGLVHATLQSGFAKCTLIRDDSERPESFWIEREIGSEPRIYQDGVEELIEKGILHAVEIYSQGDLQSIAENERRRLELIDRPNKQRIDELHEKRRQIARQLVGLGPKIRAKASEIEAHKDTLSNLGDLRSQLCQFQAQRPQLPSELDAERAAALGRKQLIDDIKQALAAKETFRNALSVAARTVPDLAPLASSLREVSSLAASHIGAFFDRLIEFREHLDRDIAILSTEDPTSFLNELEAEFDQRNARYRQLRQEQQDVNDALKKEDNLRQQILHLERIESELEGLTKDQQQLVQHRSELRRQLHQLGDQIYQLRQQEVSKINERHSEVVILTLEHGTRSYEYTRLLSELLQGSRLHGQESVARELATNFRPSDLIDIIETGDSSRLATVLNRDHSQMARLIAFLMDHQKLHDIEGSIFDDHLEIFFYDKQTPKPVSQLSRGQMATALLPLILRPAPYPLVFDQPEDDLDNSFIYKSLVVQIQQLKQERQLIFVTHNANIPVLGEADSVVVMEMDSPIAARRPTVGTVDSVKSHILDLLEGGSDAFRRRQQKYDSLLSQGEDQNGAK